MKDLEERLSDFAEHHPRLSVGLVVSYLGVKLCYALVKDYIREKRSVKHPDFQKPPYEFLE